LDDKSERRQGVEELGRKARLISASVVRGRGSEFGFRQPHIDDEVV
jgi:hypothetical protein